MTVTQPLQGAARLVAALLLSAAPGPTGTGTEPPKERSPADVRRDASWEILYCEGIWWERTRNDPAKALETFDLIAHGDSAEPSLRDRSLYRAARCALALGDPEGARKRIERLLNLPPDERLGVSLRRASERLLQELSDEPR